MAENLQEVAVTSSWLDLTTIAGLSGISGVTTMIQNQSVWEVRVVFSASATAPAADVGSWKLKTDGDYVVGTAAHVWVRSIGTSGIVEVGTTD